MEYDSCIHEKHVAGLGLNCEESFYGSVTVGERGQIVIPSEARAELGFLPGDKLLVMRHPIYHGIMVFKFEAVREFLSEMERSLKTVELEAGE